MGLNTNERQEVDYFTGYEVEHTICYNKKTLFVVGQKPVEEIVKLAKDHECDHVYFGTSQSFCPESDEEIVEWVSMIDNVLAQNFWVTLDYDVAYSYDENSPILDLNSYEKFVPMISVKIPSVKKYNYNATLKIDDVTWGYSNPGVWTHPLNELMTRDNFTHWEQYTKDTEIK